MSNDLDSLEESIQLGQEALQLCPPGNSYRASTLSSLGTSFFQQCSMTGNHTSIQRSLQLHQESLDLCPSGNPDHAHFLIATALSYMLQFELLDTPASLEFAIKHLTSAAAHSISSASNLFKQLEPGLAWLHALVLRQEPPLMALFPPFLDAYQAAIQLLPRVASSDLELHAHLSALNGSEAMGLGASLVVFVMNKTEEAVELLEETQSVFWSQALCYFTGSTHSIRPRSVSMPINWTSPDQTSPFGHP